MALYVPSVIAVTLLLALPWSNHSGLLSAFYILSLGGFISSWAMVVGWVAVTTSGHTKVR